MTKKAMPTNLNYYLLISLTIITIISHIPTLYAQESVFVNEGEKFIFTHYILVIFIGLAALSFGFFIIGKVMMRLRTQDKLKHILTTSILLKEFPSVTPNYKLNNVLRLMREHNTYSLVVISHQKHPEGIITKNNIDTFIEEKQKSPETKNEIIVLTNYSVQDVMKKDVMTVSQHDNLPATMQLMQQNNLSFVPVVTVDNRILGIITRDKIFAVVTELLTRK